MNEYGGATLKYTVVFIYNNINNNNNLTYPSVYLLCAFGFQWESLTSLHVPHRCTGSLLSLVWAFPLNPSPQYPKAVPPNKHSCLIYKIAVTKIFLVFHKNTNYHDRGIFSWVLQRTLLFLTSSTVFDLKYIIKISFDGIIHVWKHDEGFTY